MEKTQEQIVKDRIDEAGEVSRNWCLRHFITRLAAIISNLKAQGYIFETERREGDYVYKKSDGQLKMKI